VGDGALTAAEFARRMAALGPFERRPRLAVAVSGGPDSLALAFLAQRWAARRGGGILALTVDHGLRPEAAAEAHQVHDWLAGYSIPHRILRWRDPARRVARQAAARAARYRLLGDCCRAAGILHLVLAHHRDDQAETLLLRLAHGSGPEGLAGMAAVAALPEGAGEGLGGPRLIRPLLEVPKARLVATLKARRQPFVSDPSNQNLVHERVRLRALMPVLAQDGLTPEHLAGAAAALGRVRACLDQSVAGVLARAVAIYPAGFAIVALEPLLAAPGEIGRRALGRCLVAIGGGEHPPRQERLRRLHAEIVAKGDAFAGRTLGGCRILPRSPGLLICREASAMAASVRVEPGRSARWDGRFAVQPPSRLGRGLRLGALGADGWATVATANPALRRQALPAAVRPSLPAIFDARGLVAVPYLGYRRPGAKLPAGLALAFAPAYPLAGGRFTVA